MTYREFIPELSKILSLDVSLNDLTSLDHEHLAPLSQLRLLNASLNRIYRSEMWPQYRSQYMVLIILYFLMFLCFLDFLEILFKYLKINIPGRYFENLRYYPLLLHALIVAFYCFLYLGVCLCHDQMKRINKKINRFNMFNLSNSRLLFETKLPGLLVHSHCCFSSWYWSAMVHFVLNELYNLYIYFFSHITCFRFYYFSTNSDFPVSKSCTTSTPSTCHTTTSKGCPSSWPAAGRSYVWTSQSTWSRTSPSCLHSRTFGSSISGTIRYFWNVEMSSSPWHALLALDIAASCWLMGDQLILLQEPLDVWCHTTDGKSAGTPCDHLHFKCC